MTDPAIITGRAPWRSGEVAADPNQVRDPSDQGDGRVEGGRSGRFPDRAARAAMAEVLQELHGISRTVPYGFEARTWQVTHPDFPGRQVAITHATMTVNLVAAPPVKGQGKAADPVTGRELVEFGARIQRELDASVNRQGPVQHRGQPHFLRLHVVSTDTEPSSTGDPSWIEDGSREQGDRSATPVRTIEVGRTRSGSNRRETRMQRAAAWLAGSSATRTDGTHGTDGNDATPGHDEFTLFLDTRAGELVHEIVHGFGVGDPGLGLPGRRRPARTIDLMSTPVAADGGVSPLSQESVIEVPCNASTTATATPRATTAPATPATPSTPTTRPTPARTGAWPRVCAAAPRPGRGQGLAGAVANDGPRKTPSRCRRVASGPAAIGLIAGSRHLRPTHLGSRHLGSTRLGSTRLGSRRLGSTRLGSTRLGSRRLGSRRLGLTTGRSPRWPGWAWPWTRCRVMESAS